MGYGKYEVSIGITASHVSGDLTYDDSFLGQKICVDRKNNGKDRKLDPTERRFATLHWQVLPWSF